jgi:hypothetical protein
MLSITLTHGNIIFQITVDIIPKTTYIVLFGHTHFVFPTKSSINLFVNVYSHVKEFNISFLGIYCIKLDTIGP